MTASNDVPQSLLSCSIAYAVGSTTARARGFEISYFNGKIMFQKFDIDDRILLPWPEVADGNLTTDFPGKELTPFQLIYTIWPHTGDPSVRFRPMAHMHVAGWHCTAT